MGKRRKITKRNVIFGERRERDLAEKVEVSRVEGSHSGLVRRFAKPLYGVNPYRGFESLSLRTRHLLSAKPSIRTYV